MMTSRPPQYPFVDILQGAMNWSFTKKSFVARRAGPAEGERR
ncbi:hypothetical protein [Aromatoleum aromaticum]|nr:hypothetical protein [Aromatoleum aromaticum]